MKKFNLCCSLDVFSKLRAKIFFIVSLLVLSSFPLTSNAANTIYWANEGGAVRAAPLDGSGPQSSLISGESAPCGVAIDPAAGKIYWTNFNFGGVRVANLDGSGAASLFPSEISFQLCGVAINPAANKIYWADFGNDEIRVGNLDGTGVPLTLFKEVHVFHPAPSGVAIDPVAGKIYWSNQFSDEIRVGNLDGSDLASTLISGEDNPIGVAINPVAGKIYWTQLGACCSGPGSIRVANLDGTGILTLFSAEGAPAGVAIDPRANKIYWANFGPGLIRVGNLDGTGSAATLYSGESFPNFPVLLKTPLSSVAPNISGGAKVGKVLTCEKGTWAADLLGGFLFQAPKTFEYQWKLNGNNILNAQQVTFAPTVAGSYTCLVTASNQAGSTSRLSAVKKVK